MVELYTFTRRIDGEDFIVHIPCKSWADAEDVADKTGMEAVGIGISVVPDVSGKLMMQYVESVCDAKPDWKYGADEQLEALIWNGFPQQPKGA